MAEGLASMHEALASVPCTAQKGVWEGEGGTPRTAARERDNKEEHHQQISDIRFDFMKFGSGIFRMYLACDGRTMLL